MIPFLSWGECGVVVKRYEVATRYNDTNFHFIRVVAFVSQRIFFDVLIDNESSYLIVSIIKKVV